MPVWTPEQARHFARKGAAARWARYRIRKAAFGDNYGTSGFTQAAVNNGDFESTFLHRFRENILGFQDHLDKELAKPTPDTRRLKQLAHILQMLQKMELNERRNALAVKGPGAKSESPPIAIHRRVPSRARPSQQPPPHTIPTTPSAQVLFPSLKNCNSAVPVAKQHQVESDATRQRPSPPVQPAPSPRKFQFLPIDELIKNSAPAGSASSRSSDRDRMGVLVENAGAVEGAL
jgi:hypothetical protein